MVTKILTVDDCASVQQMAVWRETTMDLLFTDVALPRLDGITQGAAGASGQPPNPLVPQPSTAPVARGI